MNFTHCTWRHIQRTEGGNLECVTWQGFDPASWTQNMRGHRVACKIHANLNIQNFELQLVVTGQKDTPGSRLHRMMCASANTQLFMSSGPGLTILETQISYKCVCGSKQGHWTFKPVWAGWMDVWHQIILGLKHSLTSCIWKFRSISLSPEVSKYLWKSGT